MLASEYIELIAEDGSGVLPCLPCIAKERAEYVDEEAEPGTLAAWKLSPLGLLASSFPVTAFIFSGCTCGLRLDPPSCMNPWLPMGVARDNFGGPLAAKLNLGISFKGSASPATGRAFGEGGIPSVRRGVRLPLWLRPPGTGGRRSGTGDDIVEEGRWTWWL